MSKHLSAILTVWTSVDEQLERQFNAWYSREHVLERVDVPGFRTGTRYRAVEGTPMFLAVYELDDALVIAGDDYLHCLNHPTPDTLENMPRFRDVERGVFDVRARIGRGHGGAAYSLRFDPKDSPEADVSRWFDGQLKTLLAQLPKINSAQYWTVNRKAIEETSKRPALERRLRGDKDKIWDHAILMEGESLDDIREAVEQTGIEDFIKGLSNETRATTYRLIATHLHDPGSGRD